MSKNTLYFFGLGHDTTKRDLENFLNKYKDKILSINLDKIRVSSEKKKTSSAEIAFKDYETANNCRIEMNLKKINGKSVGIVWNEKDINSRTYSKNNLFFKGIPKSVTPREVYEYFLQFGDIVSAKINEDENGNHLGYGYITYYNPFHAQKAIYQNKGVKIWNAYIEVTYFQNKRERNFIEKNSKRSCIFIYNLPDNYTSSELAALCQSFGNIEKCDIFLSNEDNKQYGIVQYSSMEEAKNALNELNNREINNKIIKVQMNQSMYSFNLNRYNYNYYKYKNNQLDSRDLYIKNIPLNAEEKDIQEAFGKFGTVKSVKIEKYIIETKDKGEFKQVVTNKGYGYVLFEKEEEAKNALNSLNGKHLPGFESWSKPLFIDFFLTKEKRNLLNKKVESGLELYGSSENKMNYNPQQEQQNNFSNYTQPTNIQLTKVNNFNDQYNEQYYNYYINQYNEQLNDQNNNMYNDQSNNMYNLQSNNMYNFQYNNMSNDQYNNLSNGQYNNMYNDKYNNIFCSQYNNQYMNIESRPYYQNGAYLGGFNQNYLNLGRQFRRGLKRGRGCNNFQYNPYTYYNNFQYNDRKKPLPNTDYEDIETKTFDFISFNKLKNEEEKKDFLGERLYNSIEEYFKMTGRYFHTEIIGKITGMMLDIPNTNEIIEILIKPSFLESRIKEALKLLKIYY